MTPTRAISFLVLVVMALMLPVWLFAIAACAYAFLFGPYELLFIAVCIDALFGGVGIGDGYIYTTITSAIIFMAIFLRPYLSFYA